MTQNHVLSDVSCWVGQSENLICASESSWNENSKLALLDLSVSLILPEKINSVFNKKAWIHWCVVTAVHCICLAKIRSTTNRAGRHLIKQEQAKWVAHSHWSRKMRFVLSRSRGQSIIVWNLIFLEFFRLRWLSIATNCDHSKNNVQLHSSV